MQGSYTQVQLQHGTSWRGRFSYVDPTTGKRIHKRVHAPTKKACQQKVRDALAKIEAGERAHETLTVAGYVERWLQAIGPTVRPSTARRYRDQLARHVLPALGDRQLRAVTALDLQALYADRLAAGLSPTTVNSLHSILHRALRQAVQWKLLDHNEATLADAPRPRELPIATWSQDEANRFLTAAAETPLAALWRLAVMCGLRRGELLGLHWDDVDLARATLSIQRTISRGGSGGAWVAGEPKTKKSRRLIALPASCLTALQHHRDRQAFSGRATGPVFTGARGGPLPVNSLVDAYGRLIVRAGVPRLRFHDLRHTCATLSLAAGIHPKLVSELLGHASTTLTMDRYSHVTPGMARSAAAAMDAIFAAATEERAISASQAPEHGQELA